MFKENAVVFLVGCLLLASCGQEDVSNDVAVAANSNADSTVVSAPPADAVLAAKAAQEASDAAAAAAQSSSYPYGYSPPTYEHSSGFWAGADRPCTEDCSGHEAGYNWAEDKEINDPDDCGGNSQSFIEGCQQRAEERKDEADANAQEAQTDE